MKHTCDVCGNCYCRAYDLKRHKKDKHNEEQMQIGRYPEKEQWRGGAARLPCESSSKLKEEFIFKHPFTMIIAAPTGGGKTWFVKKLLENRFKWIQPPPERIVWLYGQWQPMYEEMRRTIPGIELVKGILTNIGEENFLDPRRINLIVIDDLMSQATNDTRISDLLRPL